MDVYVPYVKAGNFVNIADERATINDELVFKGKVGSDLTLDEGYEAARITPS